jgi:hypothetical protein
MKYSNTNEMCVVLYVLKKKKENNWLERMKKDVRRDSPDRARCWNGTCRSRRRRWCLPVQTK